MVPHFDDFQANPNPINDTVSVNHEVVHHLRHKAARFTVRCCPIRVQYDLNKK